MENGIIYSTFIDPILKPMRKRVARQIQPGERVIDIACGTGAQVLELAKTASKVIGIDYSDSMIQFAKKAALNEKISNAEFLVYDATNLSDFKNKEFEIAIMTLALHQFSPNDYSLILNEMKRIASKLIFVDYAVPLPKNYVGVGCKIAEFIAGKEHNRNFKSYSKLGGLSSILQKHGLRIDKTELFAKGAFQLVVCK